MESRCSKELESRRGKSWPVFTPPFCGLERLPRVWGGQQHHRPLGGITGRQGEARSPKGALACGKAQGQLEWWHEGREGTVSTVTLIPSDGLIERRRTDFTDYIVFSNTIQTRNI